MKRYLNYIFAIGTFSIFFFYLKYDFLSCLAISIFSYWIISLLIRANESLPIKELFLSLYGLQYLFSAALTYNGYENYTVEAYYMKINSNDYFLYTIPVFLMFSLGFDVFSPPYQIRINRISIDKWININPNLPYYFIAIGFFSPFLTTILPGSLVFVGYLLESFKFVGLFALILSYQKTKPLILILIYGLVIVSSFIGGMFHDLLTWLIVLGLVLAYRFKPTIMVKLISIMIFISFAIFIQSIKGGLREKTWTGESEVSLGLIQNISVENNEAKGGFFSTDNIAPQLNRVNQGWILASTIDNVPNNVDHSHGKLLLLYLHSAIMPRLFAPNKLNSGDASIFSEYSNHDVTGATMALGLFADAYIEFGQYGALLYVFVFGLMYGYILNQFFVRSVKYPVLILFLILAFIYPMRPDCETQTVLGHLFKTIMLLSVIFYFFKKTFELPHVKTI
jgi:hypothetical protein